MKILACISAIWFAYKCTAALREWARSARERHERESREHWRQYFPGRGKP